MKTKLLNVLTGVILLIMPNINHAQSPDFGNISTKTSMVIAHKPLPPMLGTKQSLPAIPKKLSLHGLFPFSNALKKNADERSTNSIASRIIGETVYANNGANFYAEDSTTYTYTGTRGGDLNKNNPILFSNSENYYYDTLKDIYDTEWYYTNTYNNNNNVLITIGQYWTGTAWDTAQQTLYTYDANNNQTSQIYQYWNDTGWVSEQQQLYTYDANNNQTSYTSQQWNTTTSAWVNNFQTLSTYDINNNQTSYTYKYWNTTTSVLYYGEQSFYTYNSNNNQTSETDQSWDTTTVVWVNTYHYYLETYNSNNYITSVTDQAWNNTTSAWVNTDYLLVTYNSNNDFISLIDQQWDTNTSKWVVNYEQDLFTWNTNNYETSEIDQLWNTITSTWDSQYKRNYTYDGNNNQLSEIDQEDTLNTGTWTNQDEQLNTYNSFNQQTSYIYYPIWYGGWVESPNDQEHFYYYQDYTAGINQVLNVGQCTLYPNPTSDYVHTSIELKQASNLQLHLVNILGQTVWSTDAGTVTNYQNNIPVANLSDGVYLLEILTGNGSESQKVVVSHQ